MFLYSGAGGEAFLKDLPHAEIYRLDAGHFAVEDHLEFISKHMHDFSRRWSRNHRAPSNSSCFIVVHYPKESCL